MTSDIVEYHGWVVMKCDDPNWSDDEWEAARDGVRALLADLHERDGHAPHLDWPANGGSVAALNGWTVRPDDLLDVLRQVGELAPNSYGEIVLFPTAKPDDAKRRRYSLRDRRVTSHPME